MKGSIFVCFLVHFYLISGSSPVFIWSNDRTADFPRVIAGHHMSKNEFAFKYLDKLSGPVVVFVQNKLSITDILVHGGVYGSTSKSVDYEHLKKAMTEFSSTFLPNVEDPFNSLLLLTSGKDSLNLINVTPQDIESSLPKINLNDNSLIVIDLSLDKGSEVERDAIIGKAISHLKDKCSFTALLTGRQMEIKFNEVPEKHEKMRHLMQYYDLNITHIVDESFIIIFEALEIDNETLAANATSVTENGCINNGSEVPSDLSSCSVTLKFESKKYGDIYLKIEFQTSGPKNPGYWFVRNTTMSYKVNSQNITIWMSRGFILPTPIGFSYSCSEQPTLKKHMSESITDYPSLTFKEFQIQVFIGNGTEFGYYNDCVGFFTIPIWMFLITAAVLLSILAFGIIMLLGVNTMDRYDDPKGKTIVVPTSD